MLDRDRSCLTLVVVVLILCLCCYCDAIPFPLTIIHLGDVLGHVYPLYVCNNNNNNNDSNSSYDGYSSLCTCFTSNTTKNCFGGLWNQAGLIENIGETAQNFITIVTGNIYTGSLEATLAGISNMSLLFNQMNYDVIVPGPLDYDLFNPESSLLDSINLFNLSKFSIVLSNVHNLSYAHPYKIFNFRGTKVGVLGVIACSKNCSTGFPREVYVEDVVSGIARGVDLLLKQSVSIIVLALSHFHRKEYNEKLFDTIPGIDIILYSSDMKVNYPNYIKSPSGRNIPILNSGVGYKYLSTYNATFDEDGNIIDDAGEQILITPISLQNEVVQNIFTKAELFNSFLETKEFIGYVDFKYDTSCLLSTLGNFYVDAMRVETGSDFAILQNSTIKTHLGGNFTYSDLYLNIPFKNKVIVVSLNESLLKDVLQFIISNDLCILFSGVSFEVGDKTIIQNVQIMTKNQTYVPLSDYHTNLTMAITDYLLEGRDGFNFSLPEVYQSKVLFQIVVQHLKAHPRIPLVVQPKIKYINITKNLAQIKYEYYNLVIWPMLAILVILLCIIIYLAVNITHLDWKELPPEISSLFTKYKTWEKVNRYYKRNIRRESIKIKMYLKELQCDNMPITRISMVFNPTVMSNFINTVKLLKQRFSEQKNLFYSDRWRKTSDAQKREIVLNHCKNFCSKFPWNKEEGVTIVPALHGTNEKVAHSISMTGFVALSSYDMGWYGKGIYFSTIGNYTLPYLIEKQNPVLIISFVILGHSYPVIEAHQEKNGLVGSSLKSGFNSHYVLTNRDGYIFNESDTSKDCYTEIVIQQEGQVVPVFLLHLDENEVSVLANNFKREIQNHIENENPDEIAGSIYYSW